MNNIQISKLDAAKRQLEVAIQFFFRYGDPVSTHSLAGAAHQILEDICAERGINSMQKDVLSQVKIEYKDDFKKRINAAKNFFKHANKDPDGILAFNLDSTPLIIWDACRMYNTLTSEKIPLIGTFNLWHYANNPDSLILTEQQRKVLDDGIRGLDPQNRGEFLNLLNLLEESHYKF